MSLLASWLLNGNDKDIRDGTTANTLSVARRLSRERQMREGSEKEKRACMQDRVQPIKAAARAEQIIRNNNRTHTLHELKSIV